MKESSRSPVPYQSNEAGSGAGGVPLRKSAPASKPADDIDAVTAVTAVTATSTAPTLAPPTPSSTTATTPTLTPPTLSSAPTHTPPTLSSPPPPAPVAAQELVRSPPRKFVRLIFQHPYQPPAMRDLRSPKMSEKVRPTNQEPIDGAHLPLPPPSLPPPARQQSSRTRPSTVIVQESGDRARAASTAATTSTATFAHGPTVSTPFQPPPDSFRYSQYIKGPAGRERRSPTIQGLSPPEKNCIKPGKSVDSLMGGGSHASRPPPRFAPSRSPQASPQNGPVPNVLLCEPASRTRAFGSDASDLSASSVNGGVTLDLSSDDSTSSDHQDEDDDEDDDDDDDDDGDDDGDSSVSTIDTDGPPPSEPPIECGSSCSTPLAVVRRSSPANGSLGHALHYQSTHVQETSTQDSVDCSRPSL